MKSGFPVIRTGPDSTPEPSPTPDPGGNGADAGTPAAHPDGGLQVHVADDQPREQSQQAGEVSKITTMDPRDPASWPREFGGQSGPEPTRYGDWEKNGRCTDF